MAVLVYVNLFDAVSFHLKMHASDTVADCKTLVEQSTGIEAHTFFHVKSPSDTWATDDDKTIGTYSSEGIVNFHVSGATDIEKQLITQWQKWLDEVSACELSILDRGDVMVKPEGLFLKMTGTDGFQTSHIVPLKKKKSVFANAPASSVASAPSSYQQKLNEMERLITEFKRVEKEHKTQLRKLLNESRDEPIILCLKKLSGETMAVLTQLSKTVGQFKKEDIAMIVKADAENICLMKDNEILKDAKRLFSYKLEPESELDIILKVSKEEQDKFDLNVHIVESFVDGNGLRREVNGEKVSSVSVRLSLEDTVLDLVLGVNLAVAEIGYYSVQKTGLLHYLEDGTCLNGFDTFYNDKLGHHLSQDDTIITKVFLRNDRLFRLIKFGENIPSDSEEEDEDDNFPEVENDDFTYLADADFDMGNLEDMVAPDPDKGIDMFGTQQVLVYPSLDEGGQCFKLNVKPDASIKSIMNNIADLTDIPFAQIALLNRNTMRRMNADDLILEYADGTPFKVIIQLRNALVGGVGGFVKKHHLKKEDALKSLTEKSMQWMNRKSDIGSDTRLGAQPASLDLLFEPLNNKMREMKTLQASGNKDIMMRALEKGRDDELEAIKNLLSKNKSRVRTEDKIYQICHNYSQSRDGDIGHGSASHWCIQGESGRVLHFSVWLRISHRKGHQYGV